jgi:hypothetical protein
MCADDSGPEAPRRVARARGEIPERGLSSGRGAHPTDGSPYIVRRDLCKLCGVCGLIVRVGRVLSPARFFRARVVGVRVSADVVASVPPVRPCFVGAVKG